MAKRSIRRPNTKMPDADIYLDDLQEIEELFRALCARQNTSRKCRFEYQFKDEVICDSIADLEQHGGHSSNFAMKVYSDGGFDVTVLRYYKPLNPQIDFPYWLEEGKQWEVRARIEEIFRPRRNRLSLAVRFRLAFVFVIVLEIALLLSSKSRPFAPFAPLLLIPSIFWPRSARVNFYYQRAKVLEDQKERRRFWRDARIAIIGSFIGGALVFCIQYAVNHLRH